MAIGTSTTGFAATVNDAVVDRARDGDMGAHETLFRVYGGAVYSLARRLLQRADLADELLQETFVEVIRSIQRYRGDGPIGAWIRRIAVSKCMMHLRSAWHRQRADLPLDGEAVPGLPRLNDASADTRAGQARIDVETALATLSPTARSVVWLHDVEGYTHQEIGELLGKTASFSKSQLARAYTRLREQLQTPTESDQCTPVWTSY